MAAASAGRVLNRLPVIVVIGATGTGKSKLALEIAQKYGGEVISADSMQVYQGLDIITNKVTAAERDLVRHHLIDCASPLARWTVLDFRRRALPIIDALLADGKVPVIVGGTNYYIESLLWKVLLDTDTASDGTGDTKDVDSEPRLVYELDEIRRRFGSVTLSQTPAADNLEGVIFTQDGLDHIPTAQLHEMLRRVDPLMAQARHPNDRRKIISSLQAWQQHGRPHSELLKAQREQEGGSTLGGPLRFTDTLIFWVQCQQSVLERRLDDRVDDMIRRGLLSELADFHRAYNAQRLQQNEEADYTKGLFQSIGFKEFHQYLVLPSTERESQRAKKLLDEGVEALKVVTRRYARKQIKWINHRFLMQPDRQVPPVYGLDGSDVSHWDSEVRDVAFDVIDSHFDANHTCSRQPLPVIRGRREEQISHHCQICGKTMVGQNQWESHLKSRIHQKLVKRHNLKNDKPDSC